MLFSLDKQAYGVQLADFVTNLGVMGGIWGRGGLGWPGKVDSLVDEGESVSDSQRGGEPIDS